jgi:hypothetical protein
MSPTLKSGGMSPIPPVVTSMDTIKAQWFTCDMICLKSIWRRPIEYVRVVAYDRPIQWRRKGDRGGICPRVHSEWRRLMVPPKFFKTGSLTKALINKQWRRHWSGHYGHIEKGRMLRGMPEQHLCPMRPKPSRRY